ncbi:uncharacterized protein [Drosophila kikkawai]|uniref:Uncharacterized protein n=1 Tax=Drosophila kikkawai TaxID=30033 RepID=A0A6P4JJ34_DROKI|nr:uncharacterized protein LOC108083393 [Drosophila kikkawai]KAH8343290.1 hypothetical protein KR059_007751 [Drosophila kikkawai]
MAASLRITFITIIIIVAILAGQALGASLPLPESPEPGQGRAQRIAQCRELCYRQSLPVITPPFLCRSRPECYMCHDYCRVLVVVQQSLATSMCADREFCTRGCRVACSYHSLRIFQKEAPAEAATASGNAVVKK